MNLREILQRHEGRKKKPYICPAGKKTIGVGWNMDAHGLPDDIMIYLRMNGEITDEMIDRLLDISIEAATEQCRSIYPGFDEMSEARRFALIDFVFNLGAGGAMKFKKMLAAVKDGDWDRVADEMHNSDWFYQVGNRGVEIVQMVRNG